MKFEEPCELSRCEYIKTCDCCGMNQKVLSQRDSFPEYTTEVYVQCTCGEFIEFILPVN